MNTSFKRVTSIMLSLLMLMSFAVCFTASAEDGKTITGSSVLNFDKKDEEYTFIPDKSDYYNFRSSVIEFGMVSMPTTVIRINLCILKSRSSKSTKIIRASAITAITSKKAKSI